MVCKNYFDLPIDKCAPRWYTGVKLVNGIHFSCSAYWYWVAMRLLQVNGRETIQCRVMRVTEETKWKGFIMEKIKNRETLMAFISEVEEIAMEKGWMNRKTYPYPSTPMTVKQLLSECRDYDICTSGSKEYLICLAEGYRQIFERWMHVDALQKVKVRSRKNGKVAVVDIEMAEEMSELLEIID